MTFDFANENNHILECERLCRLMTHLEEVNGHESVAKLERKWRRRKRQKERKTEKYRKGKRTPEHSSSNVLHVSRH